MKNTTILSIVIMLLLSSSLFGDNSKLKAQIENIPMIKNIGAKVIQVTTHNRVYQFKAKIKGNKSGEIEAFVTKDLSLLIVGQVFNANTGEKLSFPFDIDTQRLKAIAAYKMGSGKEEYFIFTDPECPYCQKLEHRITAIKKNATVYTILFPLSFHKNAKSMSRYILSQKDDKAKAEAMKAIANKSTNYTKAKYSKMQLDIFNSMIQKGLDEAKKIGINGTPTIFNAKGTRVSADAFLKK